MSCRLLTAPAAPQTAAGTANATTLQQHGNSKCHWNARKVCLLPGLLLTFSRQGVNNLKRLKQANNDGSRCRAAVRGCDVQALCDLRGAYSTQGLLVLCATKTSVPTTKQELHGRPGWHVSHTTV
jgi:hypothetical protein